MNPLIHNNTTPSSEVSAAPVHDVVSHPSHYMGEGGMECMDAMKGMLSKEEFSAVLRANVLKYIWRYNKKGTPVEDLKKAQQYLSLLIEEEEKNGRK